MNNISDFNSNFIDLLRSEFGVGQYDINVTKYYALGYCNKIELVNIDSILRSSDIAKEIEKVFLTIEEQVPTLKGVFKQLVTFKKITDKISYQLLSLIKSADFSAEDWKHAFDEILYRIYENIGKYESQVITPKALNHLGIKILDPNHGSFYDGTCGINGTLIAAHEYKDNLKLYGQEINPVAWAIGKIRLFINGIEDAEIRLGNTLEKPLFTESNTQVKQFDNIMMNFPFGLSWKTEERCIESDKFNRFLFGKPTKSNSEWLFISHAIKSLNENGKAVVITTSGTLFRGAAEGVVRENVLNSDCIEAVISLPSALFVTTSISVNMIVINMNKIQELKDKILFINAENTYENLNRVQKTLSEEHIDKIVYVYNIKSELDEFSIIVHRKDLENNNLLPSRYVNKAEIDTDDFGKVKLNKKKLIDLKKCKTLGDISEFYRGINITGDNTQDENGEYKIINLADVQDGKIDIESLTRYTIKNNARIEAYMVEEGDIIISSRGVSIKICIIPKCEDKILLSQNFIGIRLRSNNSPEYVKEFLESPLGQFLISSKQVGTSIISLNSKDLKQIPIMLLPIEEQLSVIAHYKEQEMRIKEEIEKLQNELKNNKLRLYDEMGIGDTFHIM
ncbi:putative type I restriction enzymeP M protein [Clostridium saccharobutylicum]|uniref:N-6 DNA methylase n=1 Tax=Clostridium saccharobutylicum TaxID=169679 RepID=UPI000983E496|nr:N-6 DNA methylase [Clostridium saccharobutylicum]AQS09902.1 putative type I restriction enzymeP M protein [Clostridium saccharobutylicum]MBC2437048.1 N-6 DNA methylase [Clostridium saccharobutylicum]NSB89501.1 type I restriction enzyme M protein [Clostridium saccharobutylicum]NYC27691.1 type I restriction enzyme M protein [Clostridium saccharobutylicum]OOM12773.1 putative type I restriction enzymeP M protein [Clostridium saccharobutylicum]